MPSELMRYAPGPGLTITSIYLLYASVNDWHSSCPVPAASRSGSGAARALGAYLRGPNFRVNAGIPGFKVQQREPNGH